MENNYSRAFNTESELIEWQEQRGIEVIMQSDKGEGVTYPVVEKKDIIIDGDANFIGCCRFKDHTIELLADAGPDRKSETLIHELIHAMMFEAGYDDHDEDLVKRLGKILHQVLKDNDFSFLRSDDIAFHLGSGFFREWANGGVIPK